MSDYARQYDFSAKDALSTGDPNKKILGSEVDGEFDAIVTAIATKMDNPMTTRGDITYAGASNVETRLAIGAASRVLISDGTDPSWGQITAAMISDAELAALGGLTSAADKVPYFTGSGTAAVADFTSYGRSVVAVADEAAFKALVNLEIGTDVQAYDVGLAAIAAATITSVSGADASVLTGTAGTSQNMPKWDANGDLVDGYTPTGNICFAIDGGGAVIGTGVKGTLEVPFACTITQWTITSDTSGNAVVDVNRATYANYPTTSTLSASEKPTLSSSTKGQDTSLNSGNGWAIAAGDILEFEVDSCSAATLITVSLRYTRS